ncbi:hypothetical protein M9H77_08096 [Catharanthus roseus]|uniref:Uncharacterized protein n=1 Tax=Catharanthus roseus TaxID=4058 RepID=A0ACC0BWU7_CATRO|nr:hypothetical protein M9H77_08096 [Catharanthus roseus]
MSATKARMQNQDASIQNLETQIGQIAKLVFDLKELFRATRRIGNFRINKALADLGASINVMSYNMYKKLGLGSRTPTRMSISLADKTLHFPPIAMPRKTAASVFFKRARIADPSSPEHNPPIPPFLDQVTNRLNKGGVYYPSLAKDFNTNITLKNKKYLINIKTTVKGVKITLDRTLISQIASIPNEGLAITFGSISRIILSDEAWRHSEASHRVGIHPQPNTGHFRTIRNAKYFSPRMRVVSGLIDFGHQYTKPTQHPGKVVAEEEEDEDEGEGAEDSDVEYDESDSSICATLEHMQIRQPNTRMPWRILKMHSGAKS